MNTNSKIIEIEFKDNKLVEKVESNEELEAKIGVNRNIRTKMYCLKCFNHPSDKWENKANDSELNLDNYETDNTPDFAVYFCIKCKQKFKISRTLLEKGYTLKEHIVESYPAY